MRIASILAFFLVSTLVTGALCAQSEDDIDRWYERAERAYSRGQWSRAAKLYERVHAAESDDEEVMAKLLLAWDATGAYEKFDAATLKRFQEKPRQRDRLMDRLRALQVTGRSEEALKLLQDYDGPEKDGYEIPSLIGRLHSLRGRDAEAKAVFKKLVDRAKKEVVRSAADLTGLARAYRSYPHGGDYAEEALVSAQKLDKNFLPAYVELAEVYGGQKERPSDMKREYADALAIRKAWPDFLLGQAHAAALRLGQAEGERQQLIAQVLAINPQHPEALAMRGMSQLGDALWDDAKASFEKGLAVDAGHLPCLSGLAALAWLEGDSKRFEGVKKKVFERDPGYGRLYRYIADALNDRRRWKEAFEVMQKAVEVDPEDFRLWDDLARYALYIGKEKEGRAALKKADGLVRYGSVWRNNMYTVMSLLEKNYETIETPHYILKLHRDDRPILGERFTAFIEQSWAEFTERYGFVPETPVIFEVFRRSKDFSVRTMGTKGLPALGVCFGSTVAMDSPRARRPGTYNWEGTAHHEIAHVFTLQLSGGRVPRWLTEGLSSWEEVRRDPSWGRNLELTLYDAMASGDLLGVLEFDGAFTTSRIIFAYFQAGLCARWMEETWGMKKIQKMLRLYAEDKHTSAVLKEALEISPQEFDKRFAAYVEKHLSALKRMPSYSATAVQRFREAIDKGEDVTENRIKLAWGYFRAGKDFDADAVLKQLADAGAEDPRIDLLMGQRALRAKRQDVAERYFDKVEKAGFEDFDMYVARAAFEQKAGRSEKALSYWEKAAATNPFVADPQVSPYLNIAALKKGEGDLAAWATWTERFCGLVDIAVPPRKELLAYYQTEKDYKKCLEVLDDLRRVLPFDPEISIERARVFLGLDDTKRARVEFEAALELGVTGNQEISVRLDLARTLLKIGDPEQAAFHLERILQLDAGNADAKSLLEEAERKIR